MSCFGGKLLFGGICEFHNIQANQCSNPVCTGQSDQDAHKCSFLLVEYSRFAELVSQGNTKKEEADEQGDRKTVESLVFQCARRRWRLPGMTRRLFGVLTARSLETDL